MPLHMPAAALNSPPPAEEELVLLPAALEPAGPAADDGVAVAEELAGVMTRPPPHQLPLRDGDVTPLLCTGADAPAPRRRPTFPLVLLLLALPLPARRLPLPCRDCCASSAESSSLTTVLPALLRLLAPTLRRRARSCCAAGRKNVWRSASAAPMRANPPELTNDTAPSSLTEMLRGRSSACASAQPAAEQCGVGHRVHLVEGEIQR